MKHQLADLLDIPRLQSALDSLYLSSGIPSAILDIEGKVHTGSGWQDVCTKFHRIHPEARKRCIESDTWITGHIHEGDPSITYKCPHGLVDSATPIIIEGEHIGNVFTGQLFLEEPELDSFRAQGRAYGFDEEAYIDAVKKVPIITEQALQENLAFIAHLTGMLAEMGLKRTREKEAEQRLGESEERYRAVVEGLPDIVMRFDRDGRHLFVSDNVSGVVDLQAAQFIGKTHRELGFPEPKFRFWEETIRGVFDSGAPYETELTLEGKLRPLIFNWRLVPERDAQGMVQSVLSFKRDITDHRRAEEDLRESEAKYRGLFEHMQEGYAHCRMIFENGDPVDFIYLSVNAAFETLTRLKDVVGKRVSEVIPGIRTSDPVLFETYGRVALTGNPEKVEIFVEALQQWFSISVYSPEQGYFVAMFDVITERKRAEEELRESEGKFRMIFEGSKDGILLADVESRKFYTGNKAICDMLQYSLDEIRQLGLMDIHPEEDLPWILERFGRQAKQEIEIEKDIPVKRKDGSVLFVDIKTSPVTVFGKPYLMGNFRDVTERRKTEERLTRLGMAVDQAAEGIAITDTEGRIEYVNPSFEGITGYPLKESVGQNMRILKSGKQDEKFYKKMWETISRGEVWKGRLINKKKDGTLYEEEAVISPVRNASGKIINFVAGKRDITRDVMLQKQVQTAQKMESVGTLAGGIAHDFNNVLTVIIGVGEMLKLRIANDPKAISDLDEILRSAERASVLTKQILTFSRRQIIELGNLDLNRVVSDLENLLRKVTREDIEIKTFLAEGVPTIRADQGQVEQVLMNLSLNARDAMPGGGQLVVETQEAWLEEEYVKQYPYMKAGRYAVLLVSDTGIGMDEETREHIFEPFFTTKKPDKGTGLGLAVVYGIVKQHNGFIHVYSEPGKGTTFRVYFPAVDAPADAKVIASREIVRGGSETILLAEDDESIRHLAEKTLSSYGYGVLIACNGEEAVDIFRRHGKEIAMAVLDVVMPKMGGKQAYDEMITAIPGLKVLFLSGYSVNAIHDSFVLHPGTPFLQKPFAQGALARKVREVLDRK